MFRVVLTCWEYGVEMPYADDLAGVKLSLFSTEEAAQEVIEKAVKEELVCLNELDSDNPRDKSPVFDSDGNIVSYEYPFRGDFDSEDSGVVRFWDGDDYLNVTAYNIYEVGCDSDDLDKCSYYKYRGFWIIPNEEHTSFKVEQFDTPLFKCKSLEEAFCKVDGFLVKMQYGKPSLESRLAQAALASKEKEGSGFNKEKVGEFEKE